MERFNFSICITTLFFHQTPILFQCRKWIMLQGELCFLNCLSFYNLPYSLISLWFYLITIQKQCWIEIYFSWFSLGFLGYSYCNWCFTNAAFSSQASWGKLILVSSSYRWRTERWSNLSKNISSICYFWILLLGHKGLLEGLALPGFMVSFGVGCTFFPQSKSHTAQVSMAEIKGWYKLQSNSSPSKPICHHLSHSHLPSVPSHMFPSPSTSTGTCLTPSVSSVWGKGEKCVITFLTTSYRISFVFVIIIES